MVAKHKEPIEAEIVEEDSLPAVVQPEVINPLAPLGEFIVGVRVFSALLTQATQAAVESLPPAVRSLITPPRQDTRAHVHVASRLFAGLPYNDAVDNLKGKVADEVIAYILVKKMGCPKTQAGRFFDPGTAESVCPNGKGDEVDARTHQRTTKSLLKAFDERYILIIDN